MMRPSFSAIVLLFALCSIFVRCSTGSAQSSASLPKVKHLIDTHIHLYDTTRAVYKPETENSVPWPPARDKVLHKPHLPKEFHSVAEPAGVTGVVIVEASPRVDDNDWVLELVEGDDFFVGLVGNIDPFQPSFGKTLKRLKSDRRFVGIRIHLMKIDADVTQNAQLLVNLRQLADANLALDVLMNAEGPKTIDQVAAIAREIPELRIVANHVLGYNIDGRQPPAKWVSSVQRLAKAPNVSVKISGLYQRSTTQPAPSEISYYRTVLDTLWDAFGSERLIYGSNWPVTKRSGDYASFVVLVTEYFSMKGQPAMENFFWRNASRSYRLGLD